MKDQLKTIREFIESVHEGEWAPYAGRYEALTALSELGRMAVGQEPVDLDHIACIDDGELRYMTGRKAPAYDCELYAMPDGQRAPKLYAAPPDQQPHDHVAVTWDAARTRILAVTLQDAEGRVLCVIDEAPAQQPLGAYQPDKAAVHSACDILTNIRDAYDSWGGWSGTKQQADKAINLLRYGSGVEAVQQPKAAGWNAGNAAPGDFSEDLAAMAQQPQLMVDMVPPATALDRWMFGQGRLAERDPRTHEALCERICAAIKAADDKSVDEADYMLDSDDCIRIVREQFATTPPAQQPQARPDFTDEWTGYLKDGETPFERFLRERKDLDALTKLYQRALEENERLKTQQPQADSIPVAAFDRLMALCDSQAQRIIELEDKQPQAEAVEYTRRGWINAAMRVYRIAGDDEDVALDCAKALAREQDWASAHDDLSDPYEAALEDVEGRGPAPQQAEAVPDVTDAMALAFHRALTDGAIGQSEVEDIKTGLRAALANQQAKAVPQSISERFEAMHTRGDVWITTLAAAAIAAQGEKP